MKKKKILMFSGSSREKSTNRAILNNIATIFENQLNVEIFNIIDLPHFNPDLDTDDLPNIIESFRLKIQNADGLLICTPEYVFSIPSVLKNAIEWNVSTMLFSGKPTAFIIASASGEKAFTSLDLILKTVETVVRKDSKLLIKGAKSIMDEQGEIINLVEKEKIVDVVKSLIDTIENTND